MKRRNILTVTMAAAMIVALVIGGCGASKSDVQTTAHNATSDAVCETSVAGAMDYSDGDYLVSNEVEGDTGVGYLSNDDSGDYGGEISNEPAPNVDPDATRMLIRTVGMTIETNDYSGLCNIVNSGVTAAGGYIESSNSYGTGKEDDLRTVNYVIRIPDSELDAFVSNIGSAGVVVSSNETATDVTLTYTDTRARLDSLKIEQEQLQTLLAQAGDLDSIFALQNELTEVRYQIESCESSLRVLENQVSYATVNLSVSEVLEEKEPEDAHVKTYPERIKETFKESIDDLKEFFKDLFLGIVAASPVIVPIVVIAVVVIIIVTKKIKARAKRKAAKGEGKSVDRDEGKSVDRDEGKSAGKSEGKSADIDEAKEIVSEAANEAGKDEASGEKK